MSASGPTPARRLIVGISGASGAIYGIRLLELLRAAGIETHLVMTRSAGPRDVERRTVPEAVLKSFDQIDALRRDLRGHHS